MFQDDVALVEVVKLTVEGKTYLLDKGTNEVYDFEDGLNETLDPTAGAAGWLPACLLCFLLHALRCTSQSHLSVLPMLPWSHRCSRHLECHHRANHVVPPRWPGWKRSSRFRPAAAGNGRTEGDAICGGGGGGGGCRGSCGFWVMQAICAGLDIKACVPST
eukprot:SAG22_NODE_2879_length_2130_cov_2.531265_2_plen_161_part_00